jgi:hypothetical protein
MKLVDIFYPFHYIIILFQVEWINYVLGLTISRENYP